MARRRQLLVFDRFLAWIGAVFGDAATLKGGLVLEIRIEPVRTTKDIDLRPARAADDDLSELRAAARQDLANLMVLDVAPDKDHAEIQNDGLP